MLVRVKAEVEFVRDKVAGLYAAMTFDAVAKRQGASGGGEW